MTTDTMDIDTLAADYVERAAAAWTSKGLPIAVLATACTLWGLRLATADEGPADVAAGLQRMADAILESAPPKPPRHLI